MQSGVIRVALVGRGRVGGLYVSAIRRAPGLRLAAVCDIDPSATWADELAGLPVYPSVDRLCESGDFDAAVVATPPATHGPIVLQLIEAEKPVCCEKPLVCAPADAGTLDQAARELRVPVFTAFHRRYNRNLAIAAHLRGSHILDARVRYLEDIGQHAGSSSWYFDRTISGGGCLMDNGPNALDLLREVVGPYTVTGCVLSRDATGLDRSAQVTGRTPTGGTVRADLDWDLAGAEEKSLTIETADGQVRRIDLLAGFPGFKESLRHEYDGILQSFGAYLRAGHTGVDRRGLWSVTAIAAAYGCGGP